MRSPIRGRRRIPDWRRDMRWTCLVLLITLGLCGAAAAAEPLEIIMEKGHLIRLTQNAKVVLVAEPGIADAVIESPRLIFILGKRPGETNLFILDSAGREIMQTDLVVRPNPERHVTVHRNTAEATLSCVPRCVSVATPGAGGRRAGAAARAIGGARGAGAQPARPARN
jgi:hypothetical protein